MEVPMMTSGNGTHSVGISCAICLQVITHEGVHRPASLVCGHLYGHSCINEWMRRTGSTGRTHCPRCTKVARPEDIRIIYLDAGVDHTPIEFPELNDAQLTVERGRIELYDDPEALLRELDVVRPEIDVARAEYNRAMGVVNAPPHKRCPQLRLGRARACLNDARIKLYDANAQFNLVGQELPNARAFVAFALNRLNADQANLVDAIVNKGDDELFSGEIDILRAKVYDSRAYVEDEESKLRVVKADINHMWAEVSRCTHALGRALRDIDFECETIAKGEE